MRVGAFVKESGILVRVWMNSSGGVRGVDGWSVVEG